MQAATRENRQQEIAEISRNLKNLARELDVPIIAVSQLNRSLESREDKRPRLSDLRESGSIEQDADVVMFIYRHEYYHPEDQEKKGLAEVIVAKHRAGATGLVEMTFLPEFTRFADLGRRRQPPPSDARLSRVRCRAGLGGNDVDGDRELHLRVKGDPDLVEPDRTDRRRYIDVLAVDVDPGELLDPGNHVGRPHRSEQPSLVTGVGGDHDPGLDQAGSQLLCLEPLLAVLLLAPDPSRLECPHRPGGCLDCLALGQQEVAAVPVGHVDHLAAGAETFDVLGEEELHGRPTYGRRAISRAFLMATATSR